MHRSHVIVAALHLVVATTLGAGCSNDASTDEGNLVVFAASSLADALTEIGKAFSAENPDVRVIFNFAGSGDLAAQISQGAPADVFASADDSSMARLIDAGENASDPIVIARNTFQVIVEPGNPKGVTDLADLADSELIVVLCAETVPCGKGAATVLGNADVILTAKSLEATAKGVVAKVTTGEADAGIVFMTDVLAAGNDADGVAIPIDVNVITNYPIVVTESAPNSAAAQAFVDFVAGNEGRAILASYGFLAP